MTEIYTPSDKVIMAMLSQGIVTVPDMCHQLFGKLDPEYYLSAKNKLLRKLHCLERYGMIRRSGDYQIRNPGNAAIIWSVAR